MKTDLNDLKRELGRLTDINYLKKEINRIAKEISGEVKRFDVQAHLKPETKARIEHLEQRFREALASLKELQIQVDTNLEHFISALKKRTGMSAKTAAGAKKTATSKAKRSTTKKKKAAGKTKAPAAKKVTKAK